MLVELALAMELTKVMTMLTSGVNCGSGAVDLASSTNA
jgi:hypothetical protein